MKWREDDTIRFYRDVPDKRGVSEMVINTQSYSLVLEHLERLSKENEEMEKMRRSK